MKPNHEPNAHSFCGRSLALHSVLQPVAVGEREKAEICFISCSFQYQSAHVIRLSVIMGETETDVDYITCT